MDENKSDSKVKKAFKDAIIERGFSIETWNSGRCPADVYASKDGKYYLFEIKKTTQTKTYFGSSTFTEWNVALNPPANTVYFFIIAFQIKENEYSFFTITPSAFMDYSIIPPIKIYFNINFELNKDALTLRRATRKKDSIILLKKDSINRVKRAMDILNELTAQETKVYGRDADFQHLFNCKV